VQDPAWGNAMNHPLRGEILHLLRRDGPLSPSQAAKQLDRSLGDRLPLPPTAQLQLIEICDQIPRCGAIEHIYRLRGT